MKYKITNLNATKVNIALMGQSNYRTLAPGAELFLGELSVEKAAAYKKAYNCIGCVVSIVPETPLNQCIESRLPKPIGECVPCEENSGQKSRSVNDASEDLISMEDKINAQVIKDLEEEEQSKPKAPETHVEEEHVEEKHEEETVEEAHEEEHVEEEHKSFTEEELSELTKTELKEIATEMGIEIDGRSSKTTIINAILEHQNQ